MENRIEVAGLKIAQSLYDLVRDALYKLVRDEIASTDAIYRSTYLFSGKLKLLSHPSLG